MKKTFFFYAILLLTILQQTYAQKVRYCPGAWESIERYQTGQSANIVGTSHECLTDSLKVKYISVLKNEFTDEEMNKRIAKDMGEDWLVYVERDTWKIIKQDSSRFGKIRDSLTELTRQMWRKEALERPIDKSVISAIGFLDIKEAIPALYEALKNPKRYDTNVVSRSLARLGDPFYYKKWFNYYSQPFDTLKSIKNETHRIFGLVFLKTQESVYAFSKYLIVDTGYYSGSDYSAYYHVGHTIINKLISSLLNADFREYFKKKYPVFGFPIFLESKKEVDYKDIEFTIKWMEANKGKYIIRQDAY